MDPEEEDQKKNESFKPESITQFEKNVTGGLSELK